MKLGICTGIENAAGVHDAGWDYVEGNVQTLFQGLVPDEAWTMLAPIRASAAPVLAANLLVPGSLKITGPDADLDSLCQYMTRVLERAGRTGTTMLVFGSGGARQVPEGWSHARAQQQIVAFGKMLAPIAESHGVAVVLEPLNGNDCNIINTVAEAMECVRAVAHPSFECLVDSYHLWVQGESIEHVRQAGTHIRHVHLADLEGRVAPGESGKADYRPLFRILKDAGYDGLMSVEAGGFGDFTDVARRVLARIREDWARA
jgi:sugar phosphate isomerase/epimerase